ncbi:MAG: cobyrinate a,c-diamide synthase [Acidobacteriota bacterium]
MKTSFPRIIIAGLKGGSGKTTLSLGLIAAWREEGLAVAPFKKGPDYIDAGWLSAAAGRRCFNLDPFLTGDEKIRASFVAHFGDADVAVVEGNRGLYDGMDAAGTFSTAELSKALKSPVVLIVDCTKATRTVGAMLLGMQKFDRRVAIKGVVLNQVAGSRHEKIIREVIGNYCDVPVLGAIPKLRDVLLSERHMGLTPFQEHPDVGRAISLAAEVARNYVDLEGLRKVAEGAPGKGLRAGPPVPVPHISSGSPAIGVIRDSAFQFYYPENFEELEGKGARLVEVSALTEKRLPDVDALYIGGGFPETNSIALAKNLSFRRSLLNAVEAGLPVYAECGGLMYLGRSLLLGKKRYPMVGVFPITFSLEKKPQAHGYTVVRVGRANPFYARGTVLKGHEFHYSRVLDYAHKEGMRFAFRMSRGQGIIDGMDGVCYKNVLATYTHVHAYGTPEWADGLVKRAEIFKRGKRRLGDKR